MIKHARIQQVNTQAQTNHKCMPNTNQVSEHQSFVQPKCQMVNEPCAPIYLTQVKARSSYETRDSGFDPQRSRQFVDPTRSMGRRDSHLNETKMRVDFRVLKNPSPRRNGFALESSLTFYFYFINGKPSKNKKPLRTQKKNKGLRKLYSGSGDQFTH